MAFKQDEHVAQEELGRELCHMFGGGVQLFHICNKEIAKSHNELDLKTEFTEGQEV